MCILINCQACLSVMKLKRIHTQRNTLINSVNQCNYGHWLSCTKWFLTSLISLFLSLSSGCFPIYKHGLIWTHSCFVCTALSNFPFIFDDSPCLNDKGNYGWRLALALVLQCNWSCLQQTILYEKCEIKARSSHRYNTVFSLFALEFVSSNNLWRKWNGQIYMLERDFHLLSTHTQPVSCAEK